MIKRIFANFGWNFINNIASILCGLVCTVLLTRYLGTEGYGQYSYIIAFVTLFSSVASFGIEGVFLARVSQEADPKELIHSTFLLLLIVDSIVFMVCVITAVIFVRSYEIAYVIIVAIPMLFYPFEAFIYWAKAKLESKPFTCIQTIITIFVTVFRIAGVAWRLPIIYFFGITASHYLLNHLAGLYEIRNVPMKDVHISRRYVRQLFWLAAPGAISSIAVTIYQKIDQVMIRSYCDLSTTGIYSIAVTISEFWYFIPYILSTTMLPILSKTYNEKGYEKYLEQLQMCQDLMVSISYLAILFFCFFARPVVAVLYGAAYAAAVPVMKLYIVSSVFKCLGYARGFTCAITGKTWLTMVCTVIGAGTNVMLNLLLIPVVGINGAAWATIISLMLSEWLGTFLYRPMWRVGKVQLKALFPFARYRKYRRILCYENFIKTDN